MPIQQKRKKHRMKRTREEHRAERGLRGRPDTSGGGEAAAWPDGEGWRRGSSLQALEAPQRETAGKGWKTTTKTTRKLKKKMRRKKTRTTRKKRRSRRSLEEKLNQTTPRLQARCIDKGVMYCMSAWQMDSRGISIGPDTRVFGHIHTPRLSRLTHLSKNRGDDPAIPRMLSVDEEIHVDALDRQSVCRAALPSQRGQTQREIPYTSHQQTQVHLSTGIQVDRRRVAAQQAERLPPRPSSATLPPTRILNLFFSVNTQGGTCGIVITGSSLIKASSTFLHVDCV